MIIAATILMLFCYLPAHAEVKADYLYNLSNFTGTIPYNWVRVICDSGANETYVLNTTDRSVSVFNDNGMEVYSFGDDDSLGDLIDMAVADDGKIFLLSFIKGKHAVILADFRGRPVTRIELGNLPAEYAEGFNPSDIMYGAGKIYLADRNSMKVLLTDADGLYSAGYDLAKIMNMDERNRAENGIAGLSLDSRGALLFTVPTMFSAFVLSPDGKLSSFGTRGSSPGKFNVIGGIASDEAGNYYVADTLRCVVMVFGNDFKFQTEFGYRGFDPGNLIAPMDLAVGRDGKVYVAQSRRRGVSVYRVSTAPAAEIPEKGGDGLRS